jgi:hypothetical protein
LRETGDGTEGLHKEREGTKEKEKETEDQRKRGRDIV